MNAAVEAAILAEKAAAAANEKVKRMEDEIRKTPEVTLMHQMAELKGQLADTERRLEVIKAEKNQVTTEKEQFRSNVHKLVCVVREQEVLDMFSFEYAERYFPSSLLLGKSSPPRTRQGNGKKRI